MIQGKSAVVVDPGDAEPVFHYLSAQRLNLRGILVTHHHADHVGGVQALVQAFNVPVYGPHNPNLPMVDHTVSEGDKIDIGALLGVVETGNSAQVLHFQVLEVPGHTLDHIAFKGIINGSQHVVFCGDTLFSCGAGRLFEGNSRIMLQSLDKIKKMPENTYIYCAHEYTLSNLKWALYVDPHNTSLQQWQTTASQLRDQSKPTIPTSLEQELKTNPFLRVEELSVQQAAQAFAGHSLATPADVLGALREWKNTF